jgi:hypothetical protein
MRCGVLLQAQDDGGSVQELILKTFSVVSYEVRDVLRQAQDDSRSVFGCCKLRCEKK